MTTVNSNPQLHTHSPAVEPHDAELMRRSQFPLLASRPELHYLDSAATAQKPEAVLAAMRDYYVTSNANPHRGAYALSVAATERYQRAREQVASFFGVTDASRLIFTRGTTEALNLVAASWGRASLAAGDEVIVTRLDHHANFVTWQQTALATGAELRVCELTSSGQLDLDHLRQLLCPRTRVVAFPHVSNALGTILPVTEIAALAHAAGAIAVCDGAQGAPHLPVDVDAEGADFYAFSAHKMGGPMGIGGLIGRRALLEAMQPWQFGGDMIEVVLDDRSTWNVLPHKFEAGTPNVAGAVGLAAAVGYLQAIGMKEVRRHEQRLVAHAMDRLSEIPGIAVYGPPASQRSGVVSFTLDGVHPHDLATVLDGEDVCIRAGHHCAQPLMRYLGLSATARASFYLYNDESDVSALAEGIRKAARMFATA